MSLRGLRVLVTRPAHQAGPLCAAIEAAGGHALRQPLMAIKAPQNLRAAQTALASLAGADAVIFTSVNAVEWAQELAPGWRCTGEVYAVGQATARAIGQRLAVTATTPVQDYSSEGLLALPGLAQPQGRQFGIITGELGRQTLAQNLQARGARVHTAAVYRRENIAVARARLQALLGEADAAFISSGQALAHLHHLTPVALKPKLNKLQLVVPSSRVVKLALALGFSHAPLVPHQIQDDAVVTTLKDWVSRKNLAPERPGKT